MAFSETWLTPDNTNDQLLLSTFHQPERKDRDSGGYGGIIIYVKNSLSYKRRHDLEIIGIECIWIEISVQNNKKLLLGLFYRPPNSNAFTDQRIEESIDLAYNTGIEDLVITGDFNLNPANTTSARKLTALCTQFGLTQCIDESTHFTEHSSSIIDLFLLRNKSSLLLCGVGDPFLEQNIRYHCPIFAFFKFVKPKSTSFKRHIWLYDKGNYNEFRHELSLTDWNALYSQDINVWVQNFTSYLRDLCVRFIPNRTVNIKPLEPKWLTSSIKCQIRKRKRLYRRARLTNLTSDWNKFRTLRNQTISDIKLAKKQHSDKAIDSLLNNRGNKSWWSVIKSFMSPSYTNSIPPLQVNSDALYDDAEKANAFNDFFVAQIKLNADPQVDPQPPHYNVRTQLSNIHFEPDEIIPILQSLPLGKANGPDLINNRILREGAVQLSVPLSCIFNKSLEEGIFPLSGN
ncbi:uncharacterized protein LOC128546712 [Mercenaria mercenaria]|uniref:uncharacterized protein LOC128546712 n=1 Tax=Mercenaria mercenaria TaxID=6596 RepID=UPI00234E5985|nr:uncharacterized protein LOC128546712 [Mercenaria mercenaria]